MQTAQELPPLTRSEAIFAVADVVTTIRFYREVLGFEREWLWGEPPTFGGAGWGRVSVMFCQQPEIARHVAGHMHMFFSDAFEVDALHDRHSAAGAEIISPIEDKPWGVREYTVRDPNGYHLRFGGHLVRRKSRDARKASQEDFYLIERVATVDEYLQLTRSVGWAHEPTSMAAALANTHFGVVVVTRHAPEKAVGMARVIGDNARFFYIQDVIVAPEHQGKGVGRTMMTAVLRWVRPRAPKGWRSIGLFTGRPAFYKRLGFEKDPCGMTMSGLNPIDAHPGDSTP